MQRDVPTRRIPKRAVAALSAAACVAAGAVGVVLLTNADGGGSPPPQDRPLSPTSATTAQAREYGCGGRGTFTAGDIAAERSPGAQIARAIERWSRAEGELRTPDRWWVVSQERRRAVLLAPQDGRIPFSFLSFEKNGGRWSAAESGDCRPELRVPGKSTLRWAFTEGSYPPDPDATELDVLVSDIQCSSGRDLEGLIEADLSYGDSTIEVSLTGPSLNAGRNAAYTCIGAPATLYRLVLEEPVGDREVLDVSAYPGVEPTPGTPLP